ncbi:TCR gamma alternate reading frame protein isoform X4 [Apteryx rowi]|uniref:TCR gamma alternate reading frame protein isoform X4 n=1 Tax=Apteryx rowi TaxID=308060 RepID=UPI000E1CF94D|nr:TCR gamma alternate reading frame protein isoform X4 [Apteryx rowi]
MWLLQVFLAASAFCSYGAAQGLRQPQPSMNNRMQTTARINCHFSGSDFRNTPIHWYQQKPSEAPKRILYMIAGDPVFDEQADKEMFWAEKKMSLSICTLTIKRITKQQEATYYCAYWYAGVKIFGSGTKLIVSDKGTSAPKSYEVLSSENENKLTYVCLVEKFYPEVIRVTWTEGGDEVIDNVVNGEVWKSDDDQYSIGSWLTVPKENKNKKYLCKYEHESNEQSFAPPSTQDLTKTAEKQDCNATSGNSRIFYGDHLMHRTAYLVYIVLLLKSSMYYVIVLFFVYRMRTPAKHHGKKT